jgi:hypothetical protein
LVSPTPPIYRSFSNLHHHLPSPFSLSLSIYFLF